MAQGTLLGEPAFTRDREDCLSRYRLDSQHPRWTRRYTWGDRSVGPHRMSASPDGRWLALQVAGGLHLVDLSSGTPMQRIRYDHRLQDVRFEDEDHFLVVLSREDLPGVDPWPVYRIVRCDLELDCERATPDIEITAYDMLSFLGD